MNRRSGKTLVAWIAIVLIVGVSVCAVYLVSISRNEERRELGRDLSQRIATEWPEGASPKPELRDRLTTLGVRLESGRFSEAVESLATVRPPTDQERLAAQRFFSKSSELRNRFLDLTAAAQCESQRGTDIRSIRESLGRTLLAAANHDRTRTLEQLALTERVLEEAVLGDVSGSLASDAETIASLIESLSSAFLLSRDLLTEGHAPASKLLIRAKSHVDANEFRQATSMIRLAAFLLGVEPVVVTDASMPDWFERLEVTPLEKATPEQVAAALDLCQAMAATETPGEPIETFIANADRCLQSGQHAEALWWASVALSAMGMSEEAIAATTVKVTVKETIE